jgi:hypothetical protein
MMTFRTIILILLFVFTVPEIGNSQKGKLPGDEELAKTKCSVVTIDPPSTTATVTAFPFSYIKVADERVNKTSSGFFHARQSENIYRICHSNTLGDEITHFLADFFNGRLNQSGDTLFVQVKKFWIRNYDILNHDSYSKSVRNGIDIKIEFYLRQGTCNYALYKFDSVIIQKGISQKIAGELMNKALIASMQKLLQLSNSGIAKRRCISSSQIDSFNKIYQNLGIHDVRIARKGIYLTVDELKNNKPSFADYSLELGSTADLLFVKGRTLKDSVITDALGFSDGNYMFVRMGQNFYPIYKCGDNFELYGIQKTGTPSAPYRNTLPMDPRNPVSTTMINMGVSALFNRIDFQSSKIRLFALDLESGKLINP